MPLPHPLLTATLPAGPPRRSRRRTLFGLAGVAALLHLALLGATGEIGVGTDRLPPIGAPLAVRTIELPAEAQGIAAVAAQAPATADPPPGRPLEDPPGTRVTVAASAAKASARSREPPMKAAPLSDATPAAPAMADPAPSLVTDSRPTPQSSSLVVAEPDAAETATEPGLMKVALAAPRSASASFLAAGERPPPVYPTVLPGPVTLRYELRRGFIRGTGEIRWRPDADRYALHFEARLAGISLLSQSSQGGLGANGLAPVRFVDRRLRRAARAVNFSRDTGAITFSGSTTQWPLLAGTQDRLSWMIQLGGIVAADPALVSESGRISMVLASARGEADVRTVRFAGRENAETVSGSVPALKFVVDGHSAYDGSFEIWLDPARGYLPARATSRSSSGEAEFELLLQRTEP